MKSDSGLHANMFLRMSLRFCWSGHSLIALVLPSLILLLVSGCMKMHIYLNTRPNVSALDDLLKVGQSDEADVLAVLGTPSGKGKEMFPIGQEWGTLNNYHQKQRTLWSYYYEEGSLKDDRRIFLFVFFDGDRYDGYMWFSSLADAASLASKIGRDRSPSAETEK